MLGAGGLIKTIHRLNTLCFETFSRTHYYQRAITSALRNNLKYTYCSSATSRESSSNEENQRFNDAENLKKTKLYAVMVGSAVAFFGSSYILFAKIKKAKAEAVVVNNANVNFEEVSDEDEEDSKKKKKKHGFRERRVLLI